MEQYLSLQKIRLKIIVVGDSFVGKSSLIHRYSRGTSAWKDIGEIGSTIGVDFVKKEIVVDNYSTELLIWDTAGQERFRSLCLAYFHNADGVVAVYDVTNRNTFENMEYWLNKVKRESSKAVVIIVGNKIDLEGREVTQSEGLQYSKQKGALFMETSIRNGQAIGHVFEKLVRKVLQNHEPGKPRKEQIMLTSRRYYEISNCLCG